MKKHFRILFCMIFVLLLALCLFSACNDTDNIVLPEDSVVTTEDFEFAFDKGSESYTLVKCFSTARDIEVPRNVNVYPVKKIGYEAFKYNKATVSVTLPNTVKEIDEKAFYDCESLMHINLENVVRIGDNAFLYCKNLMDITLSENIEYLGKYIVSGTALDNSVRNGALYLGNVLYDYRLNEGETSFTIKDGTTYIAKEAFEYSGYLTSVVIPDSVKIIDDEAFYSCYKLENIQIPDSVKYVGECAFAKCSGLKEIIVEDGNEMYHVQSGCLIEKSTKTLIAACKEFTLPTDGSIEVIGEGVFKNREDIVSITLPESVTEISYDVFAGCVNFTEFIVHSGVEYVDDSAFDWCDSLVIYYDGTMLQWREVCIYRVGWDWGPKECVYTIRCTDGDITDYELIIEIV